MDDNRLLRMLTDADAQFQAAARDDGRTHKSLAEFIEAVRGRRISQIRRRKYVGVLAVLLCVMGVASWSWNQGFWMHADGPRGVIASRRPAEPNGPQPVDPSITKRPLSEQEILRLRAEIAALDAEANRAQQFVELYRAEEVRRELLASAEPAPVEPLLPPAVVAQLEIDRAAAITVISADTRAKEFSRADEAAESYRSVLELFPDSRWASVARERLAQVGHMN